MTGRKKKNNQLVNDHPELFTFDQPAVERVQRALLAGYGELWDFCEAHGLRLFLTGGSTLGAVRHQGFIPWDDDIDLAMPRADFERLRALFGEGLSERFCLLCPDDTDEAISRFPKLVLRDVGEDGEPCPGLAPAECLPIDIFLIENVPENALLRLWKGLRCNLCEYAAGRVWSFRGRDSAMSRLNRRYHKRAYYTDLVLGFLFSFRSYTRWNNRMDRVVRYDNDATSLCGTPSGRKHYFGEIYTKEMIFPGTITDFSGKSARIFSDPHRYLTQLYGPDYMTPPPPEQREHHVGRSIKS